MRIRLIAAAVTTLLVAACGDNQWDGWSYWSVTNPMTDATDHTVQSPWVHELDAADAPLYGSAQIRVFCDESQSDRTALIDIAGVSMGGGRFDWDLFTTTLDVAWLYNLAVRWDDEPATTWLFEETDDGHLEPSGNHESFIFKLKAHDSLLLQIETLRQKTVYFRFPLEGATKAIDEAQDKCGLSR